MKEFMVEKYNAKIRYHDLIGDDTAIIFIHGLGCSSSLDYPQTVSTNSLAPHRRILIDLLGSGFSDKPEAFSYSIQNHADYIFDLIDHLGLNKFIIFGHSMGGAISISLASLFKERLIGIVLSEANLDSGGGYFSKKIASYSEQDYINYGHKELIYENRQEDNANWAAGLSNSAAYAIHREAKSLIEGQAPNWRDMFYEFNIPKSVIFGERSLPDSDCEILSNNNINIEIVKDAGHSMAWENPQGLSLAIKNSIYLINKRSIREK